MKSIKNLGFSLIYLDLLTEFEREYIFNVFDKFDVSISQINSISRDKILSVQSLFYGKDISNCSLVNSDDEFVNLKNLFIKIISDISNSKLKSAIFGSPVLRKKKAFGNIITESSLDNRFNILKSIAMDYDVVLYLEALPSQFCDYCNNHIKITELNEKMHVDFATMISNNEDFNLLKENIHRIGRFHLSIPGYSYNFRDYPIVVEWSRYLLSNKIPGIIEIQNININLEIKSEIEWLLKKI